MHELHDKTLVMRMLALAIVFEPAARLVRELARSVGKEVGARSAAVKSAGSPAHRPAGGPPIIHLIRNAVGHGIEPPTCAVLQASRPKAACSCRHARMAAQIDRAVRRWRGALRCRPCATKP